MQPAAQTVGGKAAAQTMMALGLKQRIRPHLARVCLFLDLTVLESSAESLGPSKISARFFLKVARLFGMPVAMRSACAKSARFSSLLPSPRTHSVCPSLKLCRFLQRLILCREPTYSE